MITDTLGISLGSRCVYRVESIAYHTGAGHPESDSWCRLQRIGPRSESMSSFPQRTVSDVNAYVDYRDLWLGAQATDAWELQSENHERPASSTGLRKQRQNT